MRQKIFSARNVTLGLLALFIALVAGVLFAFGAGDKAFAAEGDVVLTGDDFAYDATDATKITGLTDAARSKAEAATAYSIVVPDTVTEIAAGAFANLGKTTAITLPFVGAKKTLTEDEVKEGKDSHSDAHEDDVRRDYSGGESEQESGRVEKVHS